MQLGKYGLRGKLSVRPNLAKTGTSGALHKTDLTLISRSLLSDFVELCFLFLWDRNEMKMNLRALVGGVVLAADEAIPLARTFLVVGFGIAAVLLIGHSAAQGGVLVHTVGSPVFAVVDTHIFAAPTDVFPSLFPNHFPTRLQHGPGYDHEFADGLANNGYQDKDVFTVAEFTDPSAVHLGFVVVPNSSAPSGSSFDFNNGPIIPNNILSIAVRGDVFLNGVLFEQDAFGLNLIPASGFDGRSHFIVDLYENSLFAPPGLGSLVGDYEYRVTMRDLGGNGYDLVANFNVTVPEPIALTQFGLLGASVLAHCAWRRRRQMALTEIRR